MGRNSLLILQRISTKWFSGVHSQPKGKKVDEALLEDISGWREALAISMAKMNPSLDQKSLNHAVQMTIDRILFLRICEDRSIEDDGRLKKLLDGDNVYPKLSNSSKRQIRDTIQACFTSMRKKSGTTLTPHTFNEN